MPIVQGTAYWAKLDPLTPAQKYQTTSKEDTEWCLDLGLDPKAVKMIEKMNPSASVKDGKSSRRMLSPVTVRTSRHLALWTYTRKISLAPPLVTGARSMSSSVPSSWKRGSGQVRACSTSTLYKFLNWYLTKARCKKTSLLLTVVT
jgi:hypothetical protein